MTMTYTMKKLAVTIVGIGFMTTTAAAQTNWDVSVWGKSRAFTKPIEKLAELVKEKTNGEFTIKIHYGGVLSKAKENMDGISMGAFQMATTCAIYHPAKTPVLTSLTSLPNLFKGMDIRGINKIQSRAHNLPEVKKEFAKWNAKVLMSNTMPFYHVLGKGRVPKTIEDMKGIRIRVGGNMAKLYKSLGAQPVVFTASESYTAMNTGALDAVSFPSYAHLAYKTTELGDWRIKNLNLDTLDCPVIVNIDAYKDLSAKHRKALDSSIQPALEHSFENYGKFNAKYDDATKNMVSITYSASDIAKVEKAVDVIWDKWKADMKSKGVDGDKILKQILK